MKFVEKKNNNYTGWTKFIPLKEGSLILWKECLLGERDKEEKTGKLELEEKQVPNIYSILTRSFHPNFCSNDNR